MYGTVQPIKKVLCITLVANALELAVYTHYKPL
jgi:hypothetical protein